MSYTKQTWATGDTITADKLNHIETGIAAASYYDEKEKSVVYFDKHDLVPVSASEELTGVYILSENDFPLDTVFENDELTITLNGEEFNVLKQFDPQMNAYYYGEHPGNLTNKLVDYPFTYIYVVEEGDPHATFAISGLTENSTVDLKIEGAELVAEPNDDFKEAVSKVNPCFSVDEENIVYYDEQGLETTSDDSAYDIVGFYNLKLDDDELTITIDGIKYVVSSISDVQYNGSHYYGSYPDDLYNGIETEYPFCYYVSDVNDSFFVVTTEGPHDIKIERNKVNVEPTDAFKNAVNKSFYETTEGQVVYFEGHEMATDESEIASKYYLIDFPQDLEIDSDKITIIIDGESYTCDKHLSDGSDRIYYGEDPQNLLHGESMEYPFSYLYNPRSLNAEFLILSGGEHDILITGTEYRVVPTPEFETAVSNVYGVKSIIIKEDHSDGSYIYYDKTGREIFDAASHGMQCYLLKYESYPTSFFISPLAYAEVENVDDYRIGFITPGSGNLQYLNSSGAGYLYEDAK